MKKNILVIAASIALPILTVGVLFGAQAAGLVILAAGLMVGLGAFHLGVHRIFTH